MEEGTHDETVWLRSAGPDDVDVHPRAVSDQVLVASIGCRRIGIVRLTNVGDDLAAVDAIELDPSERLSGVTGCVVIALGETDAVDGRSIVWRAGPDPSPTVRPMGECGVRHGGAAHITAMRRHRNRKPASTAK